MAALQHGVRGPHPIGDPGHGPGGRLAPGVRRGTGVLWHLRGVDLPPGRPVGRADDLPCSPGSYGSAVAGSALRKGDACGGGSRDLRGVRRSAAAASSRPRSRARRSAQLQHPCREGRGRRLSGPPGRRDPEQCVPRPYRGEPDHPQARTICRG